MSEQPSPVDQPPVAARVRLARALADAAAGQHGPAAMPAPTPYPEVFADGPREPVPVPEPDPAPEPASPAGGVLARLGGAAAFDPGRPGVRVLAAVAAVVVLGAAVLAWWSRPRPEPVAPQLAPSAAPATPAATTPAELVVAVSGKVHQPGLVHLAPGARVADAVEAAGGVLPGAELDHLNLARKVTDGELVAVGIPPPPDGAAATSGGAGGKVNLNMAGSTELQTLPGIGPALAQRILDHRGEHGQFGDVSELRRVSGIGEVRLAELRDLVTV